ncbi:MAG TPA: hypothetical protein PLD23_10295 [Armatimonadota bacterium]|nr:hypothetical protein [Armatimonadota bacterium]
MDDLDRVLLDRIQTGFPISRRPYDVLADELGHTASGWLSRVRRLSEEGIVRGVSAVFEPTRIGYVTSLATLAVPPDRLEAVAAMVSEYPEVTHNYSRDHTYSLWFALVAHGQTRLDSALRDIEARAACGPVHALPTLRRFKIRVDFDFGTGAREAPRLAGTDPAEPIDVDPALVHRLCQPLPLVAEPYDALAASLGRDPDAVIAEVVRYTRAGAIRRLGALVRHHQAGFGANAMVVFRVPEEAMVAAGERLAEFAAVSHCYERPPLPRLPHNLYAMVHAHHDDECRALAAQMARAIGVRDYLALFTVTEYKKASPVYFAEAAGNR